MNLSRTLRALFRGSITTVDPSGCALGYATVHVADLRCRADPALDGAVLGSWPQGARVIVWAQQSDGWWLVEAAGGGLLGWSFAKPDYLQMDA